MQLMNGNSNKGNSSSSNIHNYNNKISIHEKIPVPCLFIVDDDENYLSILSGKLKKQYQIIQARSAAECLNIIEDQTNPHVNLFLLDIFLPEITGIELCAEIKKKEKYKNTPVMLISGNDHESNRVNGYKAGADDFLRKPYSYAEIDAKIQVLLKKERLLSQWEEEVLKNTKLAAIGLNSLEIIHNLKNTMTGLMGYIDLALLQHNERESSKAMLEKSKIISEKILSTMKTLLTNVRNSNQNKLEFSEINLNEILAQEIDIYRMLFPYEKHGIQMEFLPKPLAPFTGIASQFSHIFGNLIKNAVEALKDRKGLIHIESNYDIDNKTIHISIIDTGKGMSKEQLENLFSPFQSSKNEEGGTGLGLYSVKKTIETYNGTIEVSSELGRGTNFLMKLPC